MQKSRQDMMMVWTTAMAVSMERRGQGPGDWGEGRGRAAAGVIPRFEACLADCGKFLKRWEYQTNLPASFEACMQVKKQQLETDMEVGTGSELGKECL